jgi:hypothetical protein
LEMAGAHHLIDFGWYAREILKNLIEVGTLMDGNQRLKNGTRACVMNVRRKVSPAERALVVRRGPVAFALVAVCTSGGGFIFVRRLQ